MKKRDHIVDLHTSYALFASAFLVQSKQGSNFVFGGGGEGESLEVFEKPNTQAKRCQIKQGV